MNTNAKIFLGIIVFLVLGVVFTIILRGGSSQTETPGQYDQFAVCLKDRGAIFYGAFWCPNCNTQKKMFGSSQKLLPYVECSTPDSRSQLQVCKDKNVDRYPTWEFDDGSRQIGVMPLEQLAEKTSCPLPVPETSK